MLQKELEQIRPNIKKLIEKMEIMKSPYTKPDSPINSSKSKEKVSKENETELVQVHIDSVKNI